MSNAEIKIMKQECKRMIKENFTQAFAWMAQVTATEDFQDTVKEHAREQSGAFEIHITTESAGVPVTGVTFYILEAIGFLFGTGVEFNGTVRSVDYHSFMDSMDELSQRLAQEQFREEILKTIFSQIDKADETHFQMQA